MARMLTLAIIITILSIFFPKPGGRFKGYEYRLNESTAYPLDNYRVYEDDGGRFLIESYTGPDTLVTVPAPEDLPARIDAIVRSHKLWMLKKHYTLPFDVRDGFIWNVYIRYEKNSITSGGHQCRPPAKLREGIEKINELLRTSFENALAAGTVIVDESGETR